ncbi:MAG TPA: SUMF1/EgtB/PvdO family nonheme iron enzyme [Bacteroidia bacterium]|jgi:formylglycine-generating enzyme required for sulfatase activity|nr:SUMF1/EgtB/PvdO family nonheme iron enzyme [Bacteroidia bacterium]
MNKQEHPASDSFESLLNQAFLNLDPEDPRNASVYKAVSRKVMQPTKPALSPIQKLIHMLSQRYYLNTILILTGLTGILFLTFMFFSTPPHTKTGIFSRHRDSDPNSTVSVTTPAPAALKPKPEEDDKVARPILTSANESLLVTDPDHRRADTAIIPDLPRFTNPLPPPVTTVFHIPAMEDTSGIFPHLTDKEIKANNKNKRKMVDMLYRMNKSKYPLLPSTTQAYQGTTVTLQAFRIQNSEVCNLEYRTFLFDLLIQGRKAEFLKAKPAQQLWETETGLEGMKFMKDKYFSDSFYDDYPVVNISREGAEMYCTWLTEEGRKAGADKVNPLVKVRLPYDVEWMYAAQGGNKDAYLPWNSFKLKNPYYVRDGHMVMNKVGYFLANFCLKKYTGSFDSITPGNKKVHRDAYTSAGYMMGLQTYIAPMYSYNPNDYGLYCMSGNAAEMVVVHATKAAGTKGGSWNSDDRHIQYNAEDEYAGKTGPSPYIGFRVVMTAL